VTRQRALAIVALLTASVLCVATVEIRTHETGDPYYRFLVWNLILAWCRLQSRSLPMLVRGAASTWS
jgi:hypothetical protein